MIADKTVLTLELIGPATTRLRAGDESRGKNSRLIINGHKTLVLAGAWAGLGLGAGWPRSDAETGKNPCFCCFSEVQI